MKANAQDTLFSQAYAGRGTHDRELNNEILNQRNAAP